MKKAFNRFVRKLKEPILKKELLSFLREGFLATIVFAAMLGTLNFLVLFTPFAFLSLFVFVIYYMFLVKRLRGSFYVYHIIYSILAVLFLFLGDYVISVAGNVIEALYLGIKIEPSFFNPVYHFSFLYYWTLDLMHIITNLLSIFIYGIISYFIYQRMK